MTSSLNFVDLLPTLALLALTVVAILSSTKIVEGIERLFGKKSATLPSANSKPTDP
jgi:hypothetical protein